MITYSTTIRGLTSSSYAYTVPNSFYRALVVGVVTSRGTSGSPPSSVVYNGHALTKLEDFNFNPGRNASLWVLVNPDVGEHNLTITTISGDTLIDSFVKLFKGVDQITPINISGARTNGVSSRIISINLVTTVQNCFGVMMCGTQESGTSSKYIEGDENCVLFGSGSNYDFGHSTTSLQGSSDAGAGTKRIAAEFQSIEDSQSILAAALTPANLIPIVETGEVTNISLISADIDGAVVYDGDVVISERGFVLSTSPNPTILDTKVVVAGTTGTFSQLISDLTINEDYHIRAYAKNVYGTGYGDDVAFSTLNITSTDLIKDINAEDGETYAVRVAVTGTTGTVTVLLGTTGDTDVFEATGGTQVMQGTYSGTDGLILRCSADFDGTIDDVQWVRVAGTGTIDWDLDTFTTVFPIESEVFFKRIEDDLFNTYRLYRYLDLLFKDLSGYVTVTVRSEAHDEVTIKEKQFSVGNTGTPVSPFSKKRISFLCKDQAIIIGLSNASLDETFAIARFVLSGHKRPRKFFGADKIISVG